jgi:hypothetical protein
VLLDETRQLANHAALANLGVMIPDTLKFLLVVGAIAGAVYGSAWSLAHFPPEQTIVTRSLSNERLKQ